MKLLNIAQEIIQLPDYLGMIYVVVFKDTAKYKDNYLNASGVSYSTEQANQQKPWEREKLLRDSAGGLSNYQQSLGGRLTKDYLFHESAFFQPHSGKNPEYILTAPRCLSPETKGQRGC